MKNKPIKRKRRCELHSSSRRQSFSLTRPLSFCVFVCLDLVWDVEGGPSTIITIYSGSGSISNPDYGKEEF